MLELNHLLWRFFHEGFDGILIAHPIAAGNSIISMMIEAIVRLDDSRRAAFRGYRVAPHRINFRDNRDI